MNRHVVIVIDQRKRSRRTPSPYARNAKRYGPDTDTYIPNYDRDGYAPAARRSGNGMDDRRYSFISIKIYFL